MTDNSARTTDTEGRIDVKMNRRAVCAIFSPVEAIFRCLNQFDVFEEVVDELIPMVESAVGHHPQNKDVVLPLTQIQICVLLMLGRASLVTLRDYVEDVEQTLNESGVAHDTSQGLLKVLRLRSQVLDAFGELEDASETMLLVDELDEALSSD